MPLRGNETNLDRNDSSDAGFPTVVGIPDRDDHLRINGAHGASPCVTSCRWPLLVGWTIVNLSTCPCPFITKSHSAKRTDCLVETGTFDASAQSRLHLPPVGSGMGQEP